MHPPLSGQGSLTQPRLTHNPAKQKIACIVTTELLWQPTAQSAMTRFSPTRDSFRMLRFRRHWKTFAENVRCHQLPIQRCPNHSLTTLLHRNFLILKQIRSQKKDRNGSTRWSNKLQKMPSLRLRKHPSRSNSSISVKPTHQSGRQLSPERFQIDFYTMTQCLFSNFYDLPSNFHIKTTCSFVHLSLAFK